MHFLRRVGAVYSTLKPHGGYNHSLPPHLSATSKLLGIQKGMEFVGHPCSVPIDEAVEQTY